MLLDQEGHVLYNSEHGNRYMIRTLTRMKLGDAIAGLPIRMVPQWTQEAEETNELRGFGAAELEEQLENDYRALAAYLQRVMYVVTW